MMVKICGMTEPADVEAARGADALGFIVASPRSPRNLPLETASELMALARPSQLRVLVTVETDPEVLADLAHRLDPDVLQLHRETPPEVRLRLREALPERRLWVGADAGAPLPEGPVDALVLDHRLPDGYGGTGRRVDLDAAARITRGAFVPVVLAGGLTPGNVAEAVRRVRPQGVDVSSGVQREGAVAKDPRKVSAFVEAARGAEVEA